MLARRNEQTHPMDTLDREFGRMLNRFWGSAEVPATLAPYAVDVHEDADHFYVEAELPGFSKDDVDITLEDGVLTIRGERKESTEKGGTQSEGGQGGDRLPLHVERRWSRFERSFTLPTQVNENSVNARLNDGILTVILNKREEVKPRKIRIEAGGLSGDRLSNGNGAGKGNAPNPTASIASAAPGSTPVPSQKDHPTIQPR